MSLTGGKEIVTANQGQLADILTIAAESRLSHWTATDYTNELSGQYSIFLAATSETGRCVGFVLGRRLPGSEMGSSIAELYNIAVAQGFRRSGIGSLLIRSFLDTARSGGAMKVFLEVRSANREAIEFYRKHGFEAWSTRKAYYSDPVEDAILMHAATGPCLDGSLDNLLECREDLE